MGFFSWLFKRKKPVEIKLGLALGSGGAKGFAELGAIKAFEENGISFDYIAGTSIGSIIGAFYADGYSSTDILEMLDKVDIGEVKNLFMINMDTAKLFSVIDRNIGQKNIEELKKPFVAIATDEKTGGEYVFKQGPVPLALCASSSYPPFFKSVEYQGKTLIDGAFCNSVPADKVKEMGADYIVGIDLSTREKPQNFLSRLIPTYQRKVDEPWKKGYENSNTMLHPDLNGFTSVSFKQGSVMYEIGYECAMQAMSKIKSDVEQLKTKPKRKNKRWAKPKE